MYKEVKIDLAILFLIITIAGFIAARDIQPSFLKQGKKIPINKEMSFTYTFDKKPVLGTVIVKVVVTDKNKQKIQTLTITGDTGMPEMKGAHDTGEVAFVLNKRKEYLLPINVVMPGEWHIALVFKDGEKILFKGNIQFNV